MSSNSSAEERKSPVSGYTLLIAICCDCFQTSNVGGHVTDSGSVVSHRSPLQRAADEAKADEC